MGPEKLKKREGAERPSALVVALFILALLVGVSKIRLERFFLNPP